MLPDKSREIALARSGRRWSAQKYRAKQPLKDEWARALFDLARGAIVGPPARQTLKALQARELIDVASGVTHKGYVYLMGARQDPVADRSHDGVIAYYESLCDAPAWPQRRE